MESSRYYCQVLIRLAFSRQILEKSSNMKFHENPSRGSKAVQCERTAKQDETNNDFS
jgi:hypothetical protein